mmetsp:Transcript_32212/g.111357  ORF Transcript_32212/g.111357 Transcript_32212/m.111357 type:complete len:214 (+) Transcript_32212:204-845(+)
MVGTWRRGDSERGGNFAAARVPGTARLTAVRRHDHGERRDVAEEGDAQGQVVRGGGGLHDAHHRVLQQRPAVAARGDDAAVVLGGQAELRPDANHEEVFRVELPGQARLPFVPRRRQAAHRAGAGSRGGARAPRASRVGAPLRRRLPPFHRVERHENDRPRSPLPALEQRRLHTGHRRLHHAVLPAALGPRRHPRPPGRRRRGRGEPAAHHRR